MQTEPCPSARECAHCPDTIGAGAPAARNEWRRLVHPECVNYDDPNTPNPARSVKAPPAPEARRAPNKSLVEQFADDIEAARNPARSSALVDLFASDLPARFGDQSASAEPGSSAKAPPAPEARRAPNKSLVEQFADDIEAAQ
jgi:hypothetical protein